LEADYVTRIEGEGADAEMMRGYLAAWGDKEAYAVSHVGFRFEQKGALRGVGDVRSPRYRTVPSCARWPGNFLFSTGANEFAGRYTGGHFDIPVMRTTIAGRRHRGGARGCAAGCV
jgi:2,5-dihydroxypyridine 5,6-dioxygenase